MMKNDNPMKTFYEKFCFDNRMCITCMNHGHVYLNDPETKDDNISKIEYTVFMVGFVQNIVAHGYLCDSHLKHYRNDKRFKIFKGDNDEKR